MNRIRKYNDVYQVLVTPHHRFDSGCELMLGGWNDGSLAGYSVKEYPSIDLALNEAFNHPDIDWLKLVLFHKEIYYKLHKIVKAELVNHDFIVDFEPHLMSPEELKEAFFVRILNFSQRFRLTYNMNDLISFNIINPWSSNLKNIKKILLNNRSLRIIKVIEDTYVTRLVGETDIGTSYEIVLWTTMLAQWARWSSSHPNVSEQQKEIAMKDAIVAQDNIEKTMNLR
jgi:hypothetical protein